MRNYKILSGQLSLIVSALLLITLQAAAQTTKQQKEAAKQQQLKAMIEAKDYTFVAQSATPMSGNVRQLTSLYTLKLHNDSLRSDLPYFGRAYAAPSPGDSDGGIQFTTTNFEYEETAGKKGGWDITFKPKNIQNVQQMHLTISNDGHGTLQVISTFRQMISFYGVIRMPSGK